VVGLSVEKTPLQPRPPDIAQAGAISGAILAALVGADPLDIRSRSHWVKFVDYSAFSLWIIAVVLFMLVLAIPSLGSHSLRVALAAAAAVVACVLTVTALVLLGFGFSEDRDKVELELSASTRVALDKLCGTAGKKHLRGTIPTATLGDPFVTFQPNAQSSPLCDAVRIPANAILAIREHPGKRLHR